MLREAVGDALFWNCGRWSCNDFGLRQRSRIVAGILGDTTVTEAHDDGSCACSTQETARVCLFRRDWCDVLGIGSKLRNAWIL